MGCDGPEHFWTYKIRRGFVATELNVKVKEQAMVSADKTGTAGV